MFRDKVELTGKDGAPFVTANITAKDLTDDQLAAIIASSMPTNNDQ